MRIEKKMPRILIDLPVPQIEKLALIARAEHRSRAAIMRDAIETYITHHTFAPSPNVFGLWKDKNIDGLAYQEALRSEW
jgi:predicted transcriptional regulator